VLLAASFYFPSERFRQSGTSPFFRREIIFSAARSSCVQEFSPVPPRVVETRPDSFRAPLPFYFFLCVEESDTPLFVADFLEEPVALVFV